MTAKGWHEAAAGELNAREADWLLEPGSLTARIRARCEQGFHLDVIREGAAAPQEIPDIWPYGSVARLREVTLSCENTALIFARTLIPDPASVKDTWLLTLGSKPLGDVLFQSGGVRESGFEIARLTVNDELFRAAARQHAGLSDKLTRDAKDFIWARRSWVSLHGERILICECFLPGLI